MHGINATKLGALPSRLRREFGYRLLTLQGFALISPLEGFSHGAVEVIDEFKNAVFQLSFAAEIGTSLVTYAPRYCNLISI